jgi:hypothetical protein
MHPYHLPRCVNSVDYRERRLKGHLEIISTTFKYRFNLISWQVHYIKILAAESSVEEKKSLQTL